MENIIYVIKKYVNTINLIINYLNILQEEGKKTQCVTLS